MVAGLWLGSYHPAGYALVALPVVLWLGVLAVAFVVSVLVRTRRGRAVRARLASLQAGGFTPALVCKGDLARGETWAAFDPARDEVKVLSAEEVRSFELSRLSSAEIDAATPLGSTTPLYYSLSLYFGDPKAPLQPELRAGLATSSRRKAERWREAIASLREASRPRGPGATA
jgi:hypothetical protein